MSSATIQTIKHEPIPEQIKDTLQLAAPVFMSRIGVMALQVVDSAMVGHVAAAELAYLGIGLPPSYWLLMLGMGLLMGAGILTAQANGAGRRKEVGIIWVSAMKHGLIFSVICLGLSYFGGDVLLLSGQQPDISAGAGKVMIAFAWGMPAIMVSAATGAVMEGIKRPNIAMYMMFLANIVNVGFNWVLVYGNLGFDPMGAEGAMYGSSAARWLSSALFLYVFFKMDDRATYGLVNLGKIAKDELAAMGKKIRRIGIPLSVANALEMMAFIAEAAMAGFMGKSSLAAFQIVVNVASFFMMGGIGVAAATSVRVGNAVGKGDKHGQWTAGAIGVGCAFVLCASLGILVFANAAGLISIFTSDAEVTELTIGALLVFGSFFAFNSVNMVSVTGQRTLGIVWLPLIVGLCTTWVIGFPLAYYLAFPKEMGITGLWLGFSIGAQFSMIFNLWRFHIVAKRHVKAY